MFYVRVDWHCSINPVEGGWNDSVVFAICSLSLIGHPMGVWSSSILSKIFCVLGKVIFVMLLCRHVTFLCGRGGVYALGAVVANYRGDHQRRDLFLSLFLEVIQKSFLGCVLFWSLV
jgi:hypothetical protein